MYFKNGNIFNIAEFKGFFGIKQLKFGAIELKLFSSFSVFTGSVYKNLSLLSNFFLQNKN